MDDVPTITIEDFKRGRAEDMKRLTEKNKGAWYGHPSKQRFVTRSQPILLIDCISGVEDRYETMTEAGSDKQLNHRDLRKALDTGESLAGYWVRAA